MSAVSKPNQNAPETARAWGRRGTANVSFASALGFENVSVEIDGKTILDDVSFQLTPGEVVCLLGESGSGKSTILRVAAGIQNIKSGKVLLNDKIVSGPNVHVPTQKRRVGLMFQDFALFPHMTLKQNVLFGLKELRKKDAELQAMSALGRVGLADRAADYPHMLSGGQQQRLALARSFAPRPGVLMLDEPFSSLDARLRETVRTEALAILRETRATTIIVTHDPEEAMILADRVALLRDGRLVQMDVGAKLYETPVDLAAARFLSPLAELETRVSGGIAPTPLGPVDAGGRAEGQKVIVAIRPTGVLTPAGDTRGVLGRVVAKRAALGIDLLDVVFDGIDDPIHLRLPTDSSVRRGSDLYLHLNQSHVLVFDPN